MMIPPIISTLAVDVVSILSSL